MSTLSSDQDLVWPNRYWPRMKLDKGLVLGARGGHGPIGYFVQALEEGKRVRFEFTRPRGFYGYHEFEVNAIDEHTTVVRHNLIMDAKGLAVLSWTLIYRPLHDALVEDALDKIDHHFSQEKKKTEWSVWVKILRWGARLSLFGLVRG